MTNYANAKSDTEKALNILIESASVNDRSFPGVGSGNVSDLKITMVLLGYSVLDSNNIDNRNSFTTDGDSRLITKNTSRTNVDAESQTTGPVLLSTGGFIKNNEVNWNLLKSPLKLEDFQNATLIDLFRKTNSKIQRVFYLNDINDAESYVSLLLPLFTKVN